MEFCLQLVRRKAWHSMRYGRVPRGWVVFLALVSVSCGDPLLGVSLDGTFEVLGQRNPPEGSQPGVDYNPAFTTSGAEGTATLNGSFWGYGCGDRLEPAFFRDGSELIFRLEFVEEVADPICLASITVSDYTATFEAVPAGDYVLYAVHDYERADSVRRFEVGSVTIR